MDLFWHLLLTFVTQNENIARFARNVEWDFFCDFQTLCRSLNDEKAVFNLCFEHAKMVCCCHFSTFLKIWKWTFYQNNNHYEKWIQDCRCRYARILRQMWRNSKPYKISSVLWYLASFFLGFDLSIAARHYGKPE